MVLPTQIPDRVRNDRNVGLGGIVLKWRGTFSVPPENVPRVYFLLHVIKTGVISVRDDDFALPLELRQVIDHPAAEERAAVIEGRLVDDHFGAFRLDALHHALDAALAEVVAV